MFVVFWRSTIAPGSRSVHKPETSHQSYRSLTIGKRCYKMEANTYDQATPQPWERQLRPIPETSPAVINLNSNGTFEASFSPPSSSTTPRKHSRLSLSRNKRERKLREQALADGSSSGSGFGVTVAAAYAGNAVGAVADDELPLPVAGLVGMVSPT